MMAVTSSRRAQSVLKCTWSTMGANTTSVVAQRYRQRILEVGAQHQVDCDRIITQTRRTNPLSLLGDRQGARYTFSICETRMRGTGRSRMSCRLGKVFTICIVAVFVVVDSDGWIPSMRQSFSFVLAPSYLRTASQQLARRCECGSHELLEFGYARVF
ncbi:hypothetical protein Plhal304r1_c023g0080401 [Plasmopara halstedii]